MAYAIPLPNGRKQYVDQNGDPLVGGTVAFYSPGGLVAKDTYQDFDATVLNSNPITLDSLGSCTAFGIGRYREIVSDSLGNEVWDRETASLVDQPYEAGFYFPDAASAGDIVGKWSFTQSVTFPTNFSASGQVSVGFVNTAPTSGISLDITRNGVVIGEMVISTLGAVSFTTSISSPAFVPGDYISWVVQSGGAAASAGYGATMIGALTTV